MDCWLATIFLIANIFAKLYYLEIICHLPFKLIIIITNSHSYGSASAASSAWFLNLACSCFKLVVWFYQIISTILILLLCLRWPSAMHQNVALSSPSLISIAEQFALNFSPQWSTSTFKLDDKFAIFENSIVRIRLLFGLEIDQRYWMIPTHRINEMQDGNVCIISFQSDAAMLIWMQNYLLGSDVFAVCFHTVISGMHTSSVKSDHTHNHITSFCGHGEEFT